MALIFPNSNLPTASQPWAREVTKQLSNLIASTTAAQINNAARDAQLSTSIQSLIDGGRLRDGTITGDKISVDYIYAGEITAEQITSGTITGITLQTESSGRRVVISGTNSTYYDESGSYIGEVTASSSDRAAAIYIQNNTGSGLVAYNGGLELYANAGGAGLSMAGGVFDVSGTLMANGGIQSSNIPGNLLGAGAVDVYASSSQGRLGYVTSSLATKQQIKDLDIDVSAVLAVQPKSFKYNVDVEEFGDEAPEAVGFIAEQLDELGLDKFVNYVDGKPNSITYGKFVVALLAVVKQLNDRIETLEKGA